MSNSKKYLEIEQYLQGKIVKNNETKQICSAYNAFYKILRDKKTKFSADDLFNNKIDVNLAKKILQVYYTFLY